MSIEVSNLTKIYGEQKAVNEISFKINKGEIVGFLGPNGAGKSTTMKMITGYLLPDSGTATVCGLNVTNHPIETKKKIGYLPEANPLYYDMYVKEYLGFIADVHQIKNSKINIQNVIDTVGLMSESHKKIGQLSKGYKQRVGLAAALIHNPEVLILDEPTSGLDPNQIIEIREVIKKLGKNKTVLFSSHIMQEVQAICDRVIIIHKGIIVADDKLSRLQQNNSSNKVQVKFKEQVDTILLSGLTSVSMVNKINEETFELDGADLNQIKKQLLELALQNNFNIVSLQTENKSLEEVFRSLTNAGEVKN
ncbi:MAG TPA: gliding motility-associated ABC transporter ATP-binding subunit GldA [Chitinophagaceae bacterium]|nr:gliding motility-associated ABC transporter ATP-binding subunit GldA [Chitinophagaceae bacterium]